MMLHFSGQGVTIEVQGQREDKTMNLDTLDNLQDLDAQMVELQEMIRTFTRDGRTEEVADLEQALATCKAAFAEMLATI